MKNNRNLGLQGRAGKPQGKPFNETNLKNPSQPMIKQGEEQMNNADNLFTALQISSKRMNFPNGVIMPTIDVKQNVSNNPLKWDKKKGK